MRVPHWSAQATTEPPYKAELVNQYRNLVTTQGFITLTDNMTDVIRFPGVPDDITLTVTTFDAIVSITDETRRDPREITIPAGTATNAVNRNILLRARNKTPGSAALIQATARYL